MDKLHARPDICAFLLLDKLMPNDGIDIVGSTEHDEIFLNVDPVALASVATEDDILTLIRCGVSYDEDMENLSMFV